MGPEFLAAVAVAVLIGSAVGTFTGAVPGIHVNTAAAILAAAYPAVAAAIQGITGPDQAPVVVACCIFAASTVHSFVDFVPSVFIGAPDPDEALSVLPGHRLLMEGRGMAAVRAAAVGSAVGAQAALILAIPLQWLMLNGAESYLDMITSGVLALTLIIIVMTSRRKVLAAVMVIASGLVGKFVMGGSIPSTGILGEGTLLFPMLTGMFGIPALLDRIDAGRMPRQVDDGKDPVGPEPGLKGVLTGLVAGWFPGITATAGATIASAFGSEDRPERFIATVGSIGTVTAVFSVVTLAVSGSGRSGTQQAVKEFIGDALDGFCSEAFVAILFSIALASAIGYFATIWAGKVMSRVADRVEPNTLNNIVLALIVILVFLFTGPWGLAVLLGCSVLGMVPPALGISRVTMASCLILPALMNIVCPQFRTAN